MLCFPRQEHRERTATTLPFPLVFLKKVHTRDVRIDRGPPGRCRSVWFGHLAAEAVD